MVCKLHEFIPKSFLQLFKWYFRGNSRTEAPSRFWRPDWERRVTHSHQLRDGQQTICQGEISHSINSLSSPDCITVFQLDTSPRTFLHYFISTERIYKMHSSVRWLVLKALFKHSSKYGSGCRHPSQFITSLLRCLHSGVRNIQDQIWVTERGRGSTVRVQGKIYDTRAEKFVSSSLRGLNSRINHY